MKDERQHPAVYHSLLVPLDGSPIANAALKHAILLAKICKANLTLVCVYDSFPITAIGARNGSALVEHLAAAKSSAGITIESGRSMVEAAGLQADGLVVESAKAWRGILDTAQSQATDLIVMGSHGRNGIDKLLMGSVAQKILQRTHLPVLIVRE
jgi:nucleotide-binding universal stress UspA family protein